jgi:hypothetical protein
MGVWAPKIVGERGGGGGGRSAKKIFRTYPKKIFRTYLQTFYKIFSDMAKKFFGIFAINDTNIFLRQNFYEIFQVLPKFRSDFCPTAPALHSHCTHKVENAKGNGCTCTRCTRGSGIPVCKCLCNEMFTTFCIAFLKSTAGMMKNDVYSFIISHLIFKLSHFVYFEL